MTEKQKSATELAREARAAAARAEAAAIAENEAANDPDKAQAMRDIVAEVDKPENRDRFAKEKHRASPVYAAAKKDAHDRLLGVHQTVIQLRKQGETGKDLEASDRADLLKRVGEGLPARMAEKVRAAATEMLDDTDAFTHNL